MKKRSIDRINKWRPLGTAWFRTHVNEVRKPLNERATLYRDAFYGTSNPKY